MKQLFTYTLALFVLLLVGFLSATVAYKKGYESGLKYMAEVVIDDRDCSDYLKVFREKKIPLTTKKIKEPILLEKPKLTIILDDVAYKHEVQKIKKIPFKITPAIFPPNKNHPDTIALSKEFEEYMIHLPMQSKSYSKPEPETLNIDTNQAVINQTIASIRNDFPDALYINNHTGSKFTSNYEAMQRLYKALQKHHFTFVDSKTSAKKVVKRVADEFKEPFIYRNTFIDNKANVAYIHKQLKKAVKRAKRRGVSIAIGHPRPMTLKALRTASSILQDVEVVSISEIAKYY